MDLIPLPAPEVPTKENHCHYLFSIYIEWFQIEKINGIDKVDGVTLKNFDTKESSDYEADELLFLFGLNKKLGPILEWELEIETKNIFLVMKCGLTTIGILQFVKVWNALNLPGHRDLFTKANKKRVKIIIFHFDTFLFLPRHYSNI